MLWVWPCDNIHVIIGPWMGGIFCDNCESEPRYEHSKGPPRILCAFVKETLFNGLFELSDCKFVRQNRFTGLNQH